MYQKYLLIGLGFAYASTALHADDQINPTDELESLTQASVVASIADELDFLRALGLLVFTTPFSLADGYGDGPFDPSELPNVDPGHRPTLQGNGLSLRVNGLDAQSCNACHSTISQSSRPPRLGIGGVGGIVQNAIIGSSLIDVADSADNRVQYEPGHQPDLNLDNDGNADFNGRISNPPFLFGGGGVELLAKEMTTDLQHLLHSARNSAIDTVTELQTHGVEFGSITTLDSNGGITLDLQGIGPEDYSSIAPEEALVVRPFGRKGEAFSMRDFDRGAMQFHLGIQPVEVVGSGVDEDGDGVANEIGVAQMSVLHIFDVTNPIPVTDSLDETASIGQGVFEDIGCADCHRPEMHTRNHHLPLAFPEVAVNPLENVYTSIDLKQIGFESVHGHGLIIPLYADLKRHAMGERLAESFERGSIQNDQFQTARLWGVADTGPYLHDGRATTLFEAIEYHGGEAQDARDGFMNLSNNDQQALLAFLGTLHTPQKPNEELLDLLN